MASSGLPFSGKWTQQPADRVLPKLCACLCSCGMQNAQQASRLAMLWNSVASICVCVSGTAWSTAAGPQSMESCHTCASREAQETVTVTMTANPAQRSACPLDCGCPSCRYRLPAPSVPVSAHFLMHSSSALGRSNAPCHQAHMTQAAAADSPGKIMCLPEATRLCRRRHSWLRCSWQLILDGHAGCKGGSSSCGQRRCGWWLQQCLFDARP